MSCKILLIVYMIIYFGLQHQWIVLLQWNSIVLLIIIDEICITHTYCIYIQTGIIHMYLYEGSRLIRSVWRNVRLTEHAMGLVCAERPVGNYPYYPRIRHRLAQLFANTHWNYIALEYETQTRLICFSRI